MSTGVASSSRGRSPLALGSNWGGSNSSRRRAWGTSSFGPNAGRSSETRVQLCLLLELLGAWVRRCLLVVNVSDESMLPTLRPTDVLFCSRSRPRYVQAIVLDEQLMPQGDVTRHVKRITGLAGDVRDDTRIWPGFVWVEGDNHVASTDSRQWGPIRIERLTAVALAMLRSGKVTDLRPRSRGPKLNLRKHVIEVWRDWSRGITTRGVVRPDAFGFSLSSVHAYYPTPWEVARQALESIEITHEDVFVDYGCGRGEC